MQLKIQQSDLIAPLSRAADIVGGKKAMAEWMKTFWLKIEADKILLQASDTNIEFLAEIPGDIDGENFVFGMQGRKVFDLCRRLSGEILITTGKEPNEEEDGTIVIKGNGGRFEIPAANAVYLPHHEPWPPSGVPVFWSGDLFNEIIDKCAWACSTDDIQEAMACLHIHAVGGDQIEAVACNGNQAAAFRFDNPDLLELLPQEGILLHRAYLATMRKWLPNDTVELAVTEKRLHVRTENRAEFYSLPLANYSAPAVESAFKSVAAKIVGTIKVDRMALIAALETVDLFATGDVCFVSFDLTSTSLTLSACASGRGEKTIDADYDGQPEKFNFWGRMILEILRRFNSETVELLISSSPATIITGPDDPGYRVISMGMQIEVETYYSDEVIEDES